MAVLAFAGDRATSGVHARHRVEAKYPALTPDCPQAHWFEREIAEQWGVAARGPSVAQAGPFHALTPAGEADRSDSADRPPPCGVTDFFQMAGRGGPRGGRRPGPCRHHRAGPLPLSVPRRDGLSTWRSRWAISIAASSGRWSAAPTAGRSTTWKRWPATRPSAMPRPIAGRWKRWPARACRPAQVIRGVALELERLANHIGDLGALAGDVGFLPTQSYCGRIRGDVLNLTALLCGNRFGRGLVRPGGVAFDLDERAGRRAATTGSKQPSGTSAVAVESALEHAVGDGPLRRYRATSPRQMCLRLGLVGVAARACGLERDVRQRFPLRHLPLRPDPGLDLAHAAMSSPGPTSAGWKSSVAGVRRGATRSRCRSGPIRQPVGTLAANRLWSSLVEGWRGEICHVAITDDDGRFRALQGRRSVVPQLVRPGHGPAQPADLRFPAVQQEFQPVLLRTRPVSEQCNSVDINRWS